MSATSGTRWSERDCRYLFYYTEDAANVSYRLANVQYTTNDSQGLAPAYQIELLYEAQPEDEIDELYFGGQFIRDVVRLVRIDVKHESPVAAS